jgi:hypothetical protein
MHARCTSLFLSTDPLFQPNTQWACSKTTDGEPPHLQNMMLRDFYFFNATDGGPLVLVEKRAMLVCLCPPMFYFMAPIGGYRSGGGYITSDAVVCLQPMELNLWSGQMRAGTTNESTRSQYSVFQLIIRCAEIGNAIGSDRSGFHMSLTTRMCECTECTDLYRV